jgi:hypothetical protein
MLLCVSVEAYWIEAMLICVHAISGHYTEKQSFFLSVQEIYGNYLIELVENCGSSTYHRLRSIHYSEGAGFTLSHYY